MNTARQESRLFRSRLHIRAVLATCALFGLTGWAPAADLVKDGQPVADIVLAETAPPSVVTAANELQRHLAKISGATLPIGHAPAVEMDNHVYVGESEFTRKLGFSLDDVKHDGFKIVADEHHVILAGKEFDNYTKMVGTIKTTGRDRQRAWEELTGTKWRRPSFHDFRDFNAECGFDVQDGTGSLYATYDLLEQLGMRWYMPVAEIGIVYPTLKTISIKMQSIKKEPEFPIREYRDSGKGTFTQEFLWFKSMRIGNSFVMPQYHSMGRLMENPTEQPEEYFGKVNGVIDYRIPKLSSERFRADFVKFLEFADRIFPDFEYACMGQPDGWSVMDEEDAAWDHTAERGSRGRFSAYNWDFILDIRKRYMKRHPDKKFTVYAYGVTQRPPATLDKVPDNVTVVFCQTSPNWMLPPSINDLEIREDWLSKMSHKDQLFVFDYYLQHAARYNFPPVPIIFTHYLRRNFAGLYDRSVGWSVETGWTAGAQREKAQLITPEIGVSHLMLLLHARLGWDRNLDIPAYVDEYCELFFGPAKPEMKAFYQFAEEVWTRPESRTITAAGGFLKPADVDRYFDILARAKAKAGDSIYGKRIDFITAEMEPLKKLHDKLKRTGPTVQGFKTSAAPTIDGDLDKPFWRERGYTFTPLRDIMTGELPKHIRSNVSFRWLADNSALIVGIECFEPRMGQLRAGCAERDSMAIFSDDNVEIRLETAQGIRPFIVINSNGIVYDQCMVEAQDVPMAYTVRDVAVKKYPDRWTVEAKIEADALRGLEPNAHFPWGVHINRQRMAGNTPEFYMLSPSGTNFKEIQAMGNLVIR